MILENREQLRIAFKVKRKNEPQPADCFKSISNRTPILSGVAHIPCVNIVLTSRIVHPVPFPRLSQQKVPDSTYPHNQNPTKQHSCGKKTSSPTTQILNKKAPNQKSKPKHNPKTWQPTPPTTTQNKKQIKQSMAKFFHYSTYAYPHQTINTNRLITSKTLR
jgi:hypothetical protein